MTPADRERVLESIERRVRAHACCQCARDIAHNIAMSAYELGYAAAERSMRGEVDAEGEAEAMARRSVL